MPEFMYFLQTSRLLHNTIGLRYIIGSELPQIDHIVGVRCAISCIPRGARCGLGAGGRLTYAAMVCG